MEKKNQKIFYGWFVVAGCILITATMVPPIMALANKYLLYVTEDMGITRSAFTLVNTILQGLGIFLSPFVAKKLASGNMRKIMMISVVGYALAYASYSFATNVFHLYISGFILGVFYLNATLIPVSMMITNWFHQKRGLAMSLAMAGIGLGGFIFSPILTYLLETQGWRNTYRIMALIIFVVAFPTVTFLLKKQPSDMGLEPYGANEATVEHKSVKAVKAVTLSVSDSKKHLFFWLLLMGMFANGLINSGALGQFPPAIQELHGPQVQATVIMIYSIVGIFGKLIIGWINDKFGAVVSAAIGCLFFGLTLVFMLLGSNVVMLYIMGFTFGFGNPIGTVTPPLVTSDIFGKEKYGEAYGIANSFTQVGLSLGSLMVAAMYDLSGTYSTAWVLLIALTAVTAVGWCGACVVAKKYK